MDEIKSMANMACEVSKYEGVVATYKDINIASKLVTTIDSAAITQNVD